MTNALAGTVAILLIVAIVAICVIVTCLIIEAENNGPQI